MNAEEKRAANKLLLNLPCSSSYDRQARDEIRVFVERLPEALEE
jgi:hypothetical protein